MATLEISEYIEDYGPELGETLFYVHTHWCRLFSIFAQYSNLFGKSKKRVDLLNETAGPFFKNVQDTFHDEILLGICRLTDPAESKVRKDIHRNVSVLRLEKLIDVPEISSKINDLAILAKSSADFARRQRDKKISHADLEVVTGRSALESGASILQMREAIKSIHDVIFAICFDIRGVHQAPFVIGSRSEFGLLSSLYDAQQAKEEIRKKVMNEFQSYRNFYPDWLFDEDEEQNWKM